jgi:hypothetical protein
MKRTTAMVASAAFIAAGIASVGSISYASNHGADQKTSPPPHQFKYTLPATSGVSDATFTFPGLSNLIYNASYSILASMSSSGATINCHFVRPSGNFQLLQYGSSGIGGSFSAVSAGGSLDLRANNPIKFRCFTSTGTFTIDNTSQHSSVSFVQMGTSVVRAGGAAKAANKVSGHGPTG